MNINNISSYLEYNNLVLIKEFKGHLLTKGKLAGKIFNPYYLIKDNSDSDNEYYILEVNGDNNTKYFTKFSISSLSKILNINHKDDTLTPTWYYLSNGYVGTTFKRQFRYLHQHLMDFYGQKTALNTDNKLNSVDHINRDTLDNRISNLRICNQTQQNINRNEITKTTKKLPNDCLFNESDVPKYIQFTPSKTITTSTGTATHNQHFVIECKLPYPVKKKICWKTTKSKDKSIYFKFIQAIKLRTKLIIENPSLHNNLDITNLDNWLKEQQELIIKISKLDIIPNTPELINLSLLNFPDKVEINITHPDRKIKISKTSISTDNINNTIGNAIGNTIGNAIGNTIGNAIGNTIGNTIGNAKPIKTTERIDCPDCGKNIVKSTLGRHCKMYCPKRELTEEEKEEIQQKKEEKYEKIKNTLVKTKNRKLTDEDILLIRESVKQGIKINNLANNFFVSRQYIGDIIKGKVKLLLEYD